MSCPSLRLFDLQGQLLAKIFSDEIRECRFDVSADYLDRYMFEGEVAREAISLHHRLILSGYRSVLEESVNMTGLFNGRKLRFENVRKGEGLCEQKDDLPVARRGRKIEQV